MFTVKILLFTEEVPVKLSASRARRILPPAEMPLFLPDEETAGDDSLPGSPAAFLPDDSLEPIVDVPADEVAPVKNVPRKRSRPSEFDDDEPSVRPLPRPSYAKAVKSGGAEVPSPMVLRGKAASSAASTVTPSALKAAARIDASSSSHRGAPAGRPPAKSAKGKGKATVTAPPEPIAAIFDDDEVEIVAEAKPPLPLGRTRSKSMSFVDPPAVGESSEGPEGTAALPTLRAHRYMTQAELKKTALAEYIARLKRECPTPRIGQDALLALVDYRPPVRPVFPIFFWRDAKLSPSGYFPLRFLRVEWFRLQL